jgi:hypothetical protein
MSESQPDVPEVAVTKPPWWLNPITWIAAAVVIAAAIAIPVAVGLSASKSFTLIGTMAIIGTENVKNDDGSCYGGSGYDDIDTGTQVVVSDSSGKTVAIGKLGKSVMKAANLECVWKFVVNGVPTGQRFYKVEVGHRGEVQYTEKQLRRGIGLSLG